MLRRWQRRYRSHPLWDVVLFVAIIVVFHVAWRLGRPWLEVQPMYVAMSDALTTHVYRVSAWLLQRLPGIAMERIDIGCRLVFPGHGIMVVDHTCSGLKQFYQAFFLFLLYPGPWKHKIWYIPAAIAVMHLVNIFRVVTLGVAMVVTIQHWHFLHDWVLRPLFYVVMFALWVFWSEKIKVKR